LDLQQKMQLAAVVEAIAYLETNIFAFKSRKLLINKPRGGGGNGGGIMRGRSYEKQNTYFLVYRIKYERTVLYCGGAEIATGVPNSASSFGILSLHRLTFAVVGRFDADDADDGSAKRIRRRSEKINFKIKFSTKKSNYHLIEELLMLLMFLKLKQ
jgi:hypothetical protein